MPGMRPAAFFRVYFYKIGRANEKNVAITQDKV